LSLYFNNIGDEGAESIDWRKKKFQAFEEFFPTEKKRWM
jgi:hypothetical protein